MPFFLRLPVTSTEICPPCFKNKWNTRDSVNGTWPTICSMPPWSWTRLTATAWVLCGLSGLCCVKIHMYEINSFINTVTPNSQRTKGFLSPTFCSLHLTLSVKQVLPLNPELHQQLNPRYPSTHGSLKYKIERNKLLLPLMYLLKL